MLYELVTFSCAPLTEGEVVTAARDWIAQGSGLLLGVWRTEFGDLFQVKLLRRFETAVEFEDERRRALMDPEPFGIRDRAIKIDMERYSRFPFLPEVEIATLGSFYEFRTYFLKPGGLGPTLDGWRAAIAPAADYTSHLMVNMYALDGPPRITHIWRFSSLEERAALRARHYANGTWPPNGGPQQIEKATSTICIPDPCSPQ
jgi:hypothetical protein